jgi:hypothetical protein
MQALNDKDNGWDNTYRGNTIRGGFALMGQWCNDGIEVCYNRIEGPVILGLGGWVRNLWVHHNTILGKPWIMGARCEPPRALDQQGDFSTIFTPDAVRAVQELPPDQRTIHFYANILTPTVAGAEPGAKANREEGVVLGLPKGPVYATKFRYIRFAGNLIDRDGKILAEGENYVDRRVLDPTKLRDAGFSVDNIVATVPVDKDGRLPRDSPWIGKYGCELAAEEAKHP